MLKNVVSLFDGMSCGQIALKNLGISVQNYWASEVDPHAIKVTQANFPDTLQMGDVRNIKYTAGNTHGKLECDNFFTYVERPDLFIGGSPCTQFSSGGKQLGMQTESKIDIVSLNQYLDLKESGYTFHGQSYLFWEYVRLLKAMRPKYFLLENVRMIPKWERIVTDVLGVEPLLINSGLLSCQNRQRYYWTNIPNEGVPADRNIVLDDVLSPEHKGMFVGGKVVGRRLDENGKRADHIKSIPCLQRVEINQFPNMVNCMSTVQKDNVLVYKDQENALNLDPDHKKYTKYNLIYRNITPEEHEKFQTVPVGYTDHVSKTQRYKMLGNGWTVSVIEYLLKNAK